MKKIIFSIFLLGAGFSLAAQENPVVIYRVTTETNPAYSVPAFIRADFETKNPGMTVISWEPLYVWDPSTVWWRATYNNNNRLTHIYYNSAGLNYSVALPVLQTFVPEEVVSAAISHYGNNIYGITKMKSGDETDVYLVRFMENGSLKTIWMDADGIAVNEEDVYKLKMDDDEMKIKTDDQKIKTDDEKTKVKTDD